eukprot:GFUD01029660.1.p1 GENE.GFUD01029660.1~~GFUD01029660.1.p1  ORF type:complete len:351 (+),score=124.63 GFUD01029660.1:238-1290(+)
MVVTDPVFKPLLSGQQFGVWRVKQMRLVEVPEQEWGKFYGGDCYLVFSSGGHAEGHGGEHVFFWLGGEASQDEITTVAIKAMELDNLFGGMPVQHRELQGHESERFKKLFMALGGMVTLVGGWESGLKRVDRTQHVVRMYKVAGGKMPAMTEVEVGWASMNHGDTFVLDTGKIIFIWAGKTSSGDEKMMASRLANKLRDNLGEEIVHVRDGEEEEMVEDELQTWNKYLAMEGREYVKEASKEKDRKISDNLEKDISLYRCSDMTGKLEIQLIKKGMLRFAELKEDDAFIVEAGELGVWVWLGRRSTGQERAGAMKVGDGFIKERKLPSSTRLTKVHMGGEPEEFKSLFLH